MKNVYYPLAGMNYIIDDLAQIIENKMDGKEKINLWLSAQVNSYPHIGTLTNFISAFALAKHFRKYFNVPVEIKVELLESVTGEMFNYNGIDYYKNLSEVKIENGKTIKETYLPYFEEILAKLQKSDDVNYEILFFYDYQQDELVKKSLINVLKNEKNIAPILDPKNSQIKLRIPCPTCGLTEKQIKNTEIKEITEENIKVISFCPEHGEYETNINASNQEKYDMNVPLRYLVKVLYLLERNRKNNELNVIVDGGDWSGMWPLRIYMESLIKLGVDESPSVIYTPTILDWSGSKLSKRMYVGNTAYREYLKEGLINYSEFYNQYGEEGYNNYYNEVNSWIKSPKKFIRDYTIDYVDAILNNEDINYI